LVAFRLMPLEEAVKPGLKADWSFTVVDAETRQVAFHDRSEGGATGWKWTFGDGAESTDRHPTHTYREPGEYIVILEVTGPQGKSRRAKIWDVTLP
ncbi:MAG: PKD domain-containing protein, partial [Planctomycetaceae bacterium]